MKKVKNILLLSGICLYIINAALDFLATAPNIFPISKPVMLYAINSFLISTLEALFFVVLPIILLLLNLKNKYNKAFAITVASLNILASALVLFEMIDSFNFNVLLYLFIAKLGLQYTCFYYIIPRFFIPNGGLINAISLISLISITVGAILSIKKKNS